MVSLEVKRTLDGKVLARRRDRQSLTQQDREAARLIAQAEVEPLRASIAEEIRFNDVLKAVKIHSAVSADCLWLILDRSFTPYDGLAYYYAEEFELLKNRTPEELKAIHQAKLQFPWARIIQEGPEA